MKRRMEAGETAIRRHQWLMALCLAVSLVICTPLHSQQNAPHIGYVYPAGGRQGEAIEVEVGGQFLDNVSAAYVSGDGIQAKVINLATARF